MSLSHPPPPHLLLPRRRNSTHKLLPRDFGSSPGRQGSRLLRSKRGFWLEGGAACSNTGQYPLFLPGLLNLCANHAPRPPVTVPRGTPKRPSPSRGQGSAGGIQRSGGHRVQPRPPGRSAGRAAPDPPRGRPGQPRDSLDTRGLADPSSAAPSSPSSPLGGPTSWEAAASKWAAAGRRRQGWGAGAPPLPYLREGAGRSLEWAGPRRGGASWRVGGASGGVVGPLLLPGLVAPSAPLKATFKHLPSVQISGSISSNTRVHTRTHPQ